MLASNRPFVGLRWRQLAKNDDSKASGHNAESGRVESRVADGLITASLLKQAMGHSQTRRLKSATDPILREGKTTARTTTCCPERTESFVPIPGVKTVFGRMLPLLLPFRAGKHLLPNSRSLTTLGCLGVVSVWHSPIPVPPCPASRRR